MTKAQESALKEEIKELKHDLKEAKHDLREAETLEQENERLKAEIQHLKAKDAKQPKVSADEVERLKKAEAEREWRASRGLSAI